MTEFIHLTPEIAERTWIKNPKRIVYFVKIESPPVDVLRMLNHFQSYINEPIRAIEAAPPARQHTTPQYTPVVCSCKPSPQGTIVSDDCPHHGKMLRELAFMAHQESNKSGCVSTYEYLCKNPDCPVHGSKYKI